MVSNRKTKTSLVSLWLASVILSQSPSVSQAATVLTTNNQGVQCRLIRGWVNEMILQTGPDVVTTGSAGQKILPMTSFIQRVAPMFIDRKFVPVFGKSFFEIDRHVGGKLRIIFAGCTSQMGSYHHIFQALGRNYSVPQWNKAVQKAQQDQRSVKEQMMAARTQGNKEKSRSQRIMEEARFNAQAIAKVQSKPKTRLPQHAGKILYEDSLFKIHEYRFDSHDVKKYCPVTELGALQFSILLKDRGYVLTSEKLQYIATQYLLPLKERLCPHKYAVEAWIYFDGLHIVNSGKTMKIVENPGRNQTHFFAYFSHRMYEGRAEPVWTKGYLSDFDRHYEPSLAGLSEFIGNNFLSKEGKKMQLALDKQKRLYEKKLEQKVGFIPQQMEVRKIVEGGSGMQSYYEKGRANWLMVGTAVPVIHAWSATMRNFCRSQTPGGMTSARYTQKENGFVTKNVTVFIPNDLFEHTKWLIDRGRMGMGVRMRELIPEFNKIVELNGCSSAVVRKVHQNVVEIAPTIYGR